ncbi:MAG: hypothetical protein ACRENP_19245 [Longimicrobiales bacterium]
MKAHVRFTAFLPLLWAAAVQAQAPKVAGTYLVDFDSRVQMSGDGSIQVTGRSKARITLELRGDSIFGTWHVIDDPTNRPPSPLRGTVQDGKIKLSAEPREATVNINGQEQRRTITQDFLLTIAGDDISGTIESPAPMPGLAGISRKLEGKREAARSGP